MNFDVKPWEQELAEIDREPGIGASGYPGREGSAKGHQIWCGSNRLSKRATDSGQGDRTKIGSMGY